MAIPGFADPVADSQRAFRAVLDAMARPGRIADLGEGLRAPAPLDPATAAVALMLADQETTVALDGALRDAAPWLSFHAGVTLVDDPTRAQFVIASICPDLGSLDAGTDEQPETSATLILQVPGFGAGPGYRLSGPGLENPAILHVQGLPDGFAAAWQANHARYPRGIDVILCVGNRVAALPRSVSVEQL
ncbi:MAG: phosphonate C-P lyase system protein PhnH [Proteobacteria bacterium]|nr:phosphonate C-P lyase system protein PhnH [Pseudomonadota bacterium]